MIVEELFLLIHSLNPTEKRYLKQRLPERSGLKYQLLYEKLHGMEAFNLEALRLSLSGERMLGNLTVAANALLDWMLKQLSQAQVENQEVWKQRRELEGISILDGHGRSRLVDQRLKRIWKVGLELGDATLQRECLRWIRRRKRKEPKGKWRSFPLEEEEDRALERLHSEQLLGRLHDKLFQLRSEKSKSLLEAFWEEHKGEIRQLEGKKKSFDGKITWHTLHFLWHHGMERLGRAREAAFENLKIWEEHPARIRQLPGRYLAAQSNFLNLCLDTDQVETFHSHADRFRNKVRLPPKLQRKLEDQSRNMELLYFIRKQQYWDAQNLVMDLDIDETAKRSQSLVFNAGVTYLELGEHSRSQAWFDSLLNRSKATVNSGVREAILLLEPINLLGLGYWELMPHRYRSLNRQFKQSEGWQRVWIDFLKQWKVEPESEEWREELTKLKSELEKEHAPSWGFHELRQWVERTFEDLQS